METTEPRILRPQTRVRYLKLIALFKIGKGILLLCFGLSVLVLNSRPAWVDAVSDWIDDEALVVHGKAAHFLLTRLQEVLKAGTLQAAAVVALFYAAVLFTEGIGVYFQKRWAEFLMITATAALIPLEVRHLLARPSLGVVIILLANCFIVWFLYRVLRREPGHVSVTPAKVAVEAP
jgi:uncharacterized membrane protein (DUF2068 family)